MADKAARTIDPEGSAQDHTHLVRSLYHSDIPTEE